MDEIKARATRSADRQVIPGFLSDAMRDVKYWREKLEFWQYQAQITETDAVYYPTIERKLAEVSEILAAFEQDARQLNRKLK